MNDKIDMRKFLDGIDDKYIEEAGELENYAAKRSRIIKIVAGAAAAVLVLLLGMNVFAIRPWEHKSEPSPVPGETTTTPEPTKTAVLPTEPEPEKTINAAEFYGGNDYTPINAYRSNARLTNIDNSGIVVNNDDVVAELAQESLNKIDRSVSEAVYASVPRPLTTSNYAVFCYSIDNKNISGEIVIYVYDSKGKCVGFAEVSEDSAGFNCTMTNSSKQPWYIASKETYICVEYEGNKYLLDKTNTLYTLATGEKVDITVKGDLFSAIKDNTLAFSYEDVNKTGRKLKYLGSYAVSESINLEVYSSVEDAAGNQIREMGQITATSPSGKIAYAQRVEGSYQLELVVESKDKQIRFDLSGSDYLSAEKVFWLDDDTVIVKAHVGPSGGALFRCSEKTGVEKIYGCYFAFDKDKTLFYNAPWDTTESDVVKDENGNVYYTIEDEAYDTYVYGDLEVNDKYVAFYTSPLVKEGSIKLIVVDRETKEVVTEIEKPICGDLRFSVKD